MKTRLNLPIYKFLLIVVLFLSCVLSCGDTEDIDPNSSGGEISFTIDSGNPDIDGEDSGVADAGAADGGFGDDGLINSGTLDAGNQHAGGDAGNVTVMDSGSSDGDAGDGVTGIPADAGSSHQYGGDGGSFDISDAGTTGVDSGLPDAGGGPSADVDPKVLALIEMINDYREENGKSRIPMSLKLNIVGKTHVDNQIYAKEMNTYGVDPTCNSHSWYDQPDQLFTSCCYTPDHAYPSCMWDKPREIIDFNTNGYEISFHGPYTIESALVGWKNSPGHNNVMLNQGSWAMFPFHSIGAGVSEDARIYHVWFATASDPESP